MVTLIKFQTNTKGILFLVLILGSCNYPLLLFFSVISTVLLTCISTHTCNLCVTASKGVLLLLWCLILLCASTREIDLCLWDFPTYSYCLVSIYSTVFSYCFVNFNIDHEHIPTQGYKMFLWANNKYYHWIFSDNIKVCNIFYANMASYHVFNSISISKIFFIDSLRFFHAKIHDISSLTPSLLFSLFYLARTSHTMYFYYMYALEKRLLILWHRWVRHIDISSWDYFTQPSY